MAETKIHKNYFLYNSLKYFRGKAENVEIGAYGQKKTPFADDPYLAVQANVKREHLKGRVRWVTESAIDWNRQTKADVEANGQLRYFTLEASGASRASFEQAKSARLKLVKFAINEGPLTAMLNNDAGGARNYLKDEGADGRIVSEVWVVMEGALAETFSTAATSGGSVSVDVTKAAQLQLTANHSGGARGSATIILAPGTTFAYLLHKVTKWNKGKTRIEDMEDDSKGLN